jgi:hypothetical protein
MVNESVGVTSDGTPPAELEIRFEPDVAVQQAASAVAEAFYAGLGGNPQGVTAAIRRRDLAIARQLLAAGATPEEAERYARETSQTGGRIAPVDMRSFERERLGWLARRRGSSRLQGAFVDRTGQPPSWQIPLDGAASEPGGGSARPDGRGEPPSGSRVPVTGERLKDLLNDALGGRGK